MHYWFLIALLTPILHAVANHIDKHLISKYFKGTAVGSLVIFSSIFALIALPIIFLLHPSVIHEELTTVIFLVVNGMLSLGYMIFYLHALEEDEVSIVTPFFQMIPVFGFILGYFILGETISSTQVYGCLTIIVGGILLSLNINPAMRSVRIKERLLFLMFFASFLYATNNVLFKFFAVETGFAISLFWNMVGQCVLGLILYSAVPSYRHSFKTVIRENTTRVLGLNLFNGLVILVGDVVLFYAILLAPVTLVLAVSGFQPFFVFLFALIITSFFPKFGTESFEPKILTQKIVGISIIMIGTFFLN